MALYGWPILYALFVWWFSTGLIIWLDNLRPSTFRWSMLGGTVVFAAALHQLQAGAVDASLSGAYAAFTWAVLAWGWHEMAFFMGWVTGPRRSACPDGCGGWAHFVHGVQACLWHELAILATAAAIVAGTWGGANQVGTWTFMVLWAGRTSAKLNFFLGVRNLSEEFLPAHLGYLKSFLRQRPMNLLFPFSIMGGTAWLAVLVQQAGAPGIPAVRAAGLTFVAAMLALAVLEHWFLVLPLPFAKLWRWVLDVRGAPRASEACRAAGHIHLKADRARAVATLS